MEDHLKVNTKPDAVLMSACLFLDFEQGTTVSSQAAATGNDVLPVSPVWDLKGRYTFDRVEKAYEQLTKKQRASRAFPSVEKWEKHHSGTMPLKETTKLAFHLEVSVD